MLRSQKLDPVNIYSQLVSINYSGSYQHLLDFLGSLELGKRQIYFRGAALSRAEDGTLTGSLNALIFSSVPPQADAAYPSYEYKTPAMSGKSDPFAEFAGYQQSNTEQTSTLNAPDFYLILNTYDDNSNKILLGKYPASSTQVTSDKNQNVTATMTLSTSKDRVNYTYKLGTDTYTGSFAPAGNESNISISILSRERKSAQDNVGVTLNVQNNTSRGVEITVKNDDKVNPRFVLGTTTGKVQVIQ